jgi:hypothetical protein
VTGVEIFVGAMLGSIVELPAAPGLSARISEVAEDDEFSRVISVDDEGKRYQNLNKPSSPVTLGSGEMTRTSNYRAPISCVGVVEFRFWLRLVGGHVEIPKTWRCCSAIVSAMYQGLVQARKCQAMRGGQMSYGTDAKDQRDVRPGRHLRFPSIRRYFWVIGCLVAVALGVVFRLHWLEDIEFKGDEAWTFDQVRAFWQTHRLPLVGMESSGGIPHGGMSLWVFVAMSLITPLDDPLALTRAVQVLNVVAILLLIIFILTSIERTDREPWLWSVALVSVNPLMVLFSRKLWPQNTLPIFTLGMLLGWRYRLRWWGAFCWGIFGALLGQIHLSGFFFAAAFVGCILLFDRHSVRWSAWFAGSVLGSLPLLPWLASLAGHGADLGGFNFLLPFIKLWFSIALGVDLRYSLGGSFRTFLAYPTVAGTPIYLGGMLLGVIMLIFSLILARLARRLYVQPAATLRLLFDVSSATGLALNAAFWGYGILLTAIPRPIVLHYLIVAFSFPALSIARLTQIGSDESNRSVANARRLLATLVLSQALLTIAFQAYIHETEFIKGDYGVVYRAQPHPPK